MSTAVAAAQRVWIVDQRVGRGDFTEIQPAVDAANNGDVILVRPGASLYPAFTITAKGLVVTGDGPQRVALGPRGNGSSLTNIVVASTRAPQAVVIRNFALTGSFSIYPQFLPAIHVAQCAGPVNVEDCQLVAGPNPINSGAVITGSTRVTLIRCEIQGASLQTTSGPPPPGLAVSNSTVHAHETVILGPRANVYPSGRGGHGVEVIAGMLFATGTTLTGGRGADALVSCAWPAGDGGDALFLGATSSARLLACMLMPGPPGSAPFGCPPGRAGNRIGGMGSAVESGGPDGRCVAASPVRYGQDARVSVTGPAGYLAWLAFSAARSPSLIVGCNGTLHVDLATAITLPLGVLPGGGRLDLSLPVPVLSVLALPLVVQPGFLQQPQTCFFGTPTELLLVDTRF